MKIQEGELFNGRYRLISEKGRGAFGEVWLAHDEQIDLDVAVKIYIALDERGIEDFKSEYKTAYSLNHPNLLHAYHFDVIEKRPFLVMPFCPGSAEANIGTTDEALIWRFIKDVSSGLAYLHSKNILHRDIKPDNVLADAEGNFLITDFGVSTKMKSTLRRNSTRSMTDEDISGTIGYMAPELFTKNPEAVKATDIWAFGATLFEMINGELPFYGQGGIMLEKGAEIPELKGAWSNDLRRTVEACLAKEPWDRPTASQLEQYASKCAKGIFDAAPWKAPEKTQTSTAENQDGLNATVRAHHKESQSGKPANTDKAELFKEETDKKEKKATRNKLIILFSLLAVVIVLLVIIFSNGNNEKKQGQPPVINTEKKVETPSTNTQPSPQATTPANTEKETGSKAETTSGKTDKSSTTTKPTGEKTKTSEKDTNQEITADDNASKLQTAVKNGDYATVRHLADSGYAPAYLPLAKYYLKNPSTHDLADKYAQKAKRAGVKGAQDVIDDLNALGFYD